MAIDSSLYVVHIPAGTYQAGVPIPMRCVKGPSVVRDGYGTAILKRFFSCTNGSFSIATVEVKNSSWVDAMQNTIGNVGGNNCLVALSKFGPYIQSCGDVEVTPNSTFTVNVIPQVNITTTATATVYCVIDIDYPSVSAVANPQEAKGTPCTIVRNGDNVATTPLGSDPVFTTYNVDVFKAGYKYLLSEVGISSQVNTSVLGFIAISGVAGMSGLTQIIPSMPRPSVCMRYPLEYSIVYVKGPMNLEYCVCETGSASQVDTPILEMDFLKKGE